MKFSFAAVLALVGFTDAKLASSDILRKAIPVNRDGSRRELGNNNNNGFQINGLYVIKFDNCLSLTWQNENALAENLVSETAEGKIVPQTSYAVFDLLSTESGVAQSTGLWMLSLADWIEATGDAEQNKDEEYCRACEESYNYCYPDEANDGGRKLKRELTADVIAHRNAMSAIMGKRVLKNNGASCYEYVDCYACEAKGCFEEDQNNNNNNNQNYCAQDAYVYGCEFEENAVQDFMKNSACQASGLYETNANGEQIALMAGLMCNDDGTGVEMALFADEDCSLYYSKRDFTSQMSGTYLYALLGQAASTVMKPYVNSINCLECEVAALGQEQNNNNNNNNNGEYQYPEASETCQQIVKNAMDVDSCLGAERNYNENQNQAQNNNDNGNYIPDVWYTYDFTNGAQPEGQDVCFYLADLGKSGWTGKHVYNGNKKNGGGHFFDYKAARGETSSRNGGKVFGIILLVVLVVGVAGFGVVKFHKAQGGDGKKAPLVNMQNGDLA